MFFKTLWPEFCEDELNQAVEEFSKRKRTYGKAKFSFNLYSISQKAISNLNLQNFNKPGPTDVLSFPLFSGINEIKKLNPHNEEILGDMFFCRPILKKNAAEFHKGLIEELQLVLIHGLLHLVGYSHLNETKLRKKENEILDKVWNGLSKD
jgi:probable rRNA maturation factor